MHARPLLFCGAAAATLLLVLGCSGGPASGTATKGTPASCDAVAQRSICVEYEDEDAAASGCSDLKVDVTEGTCPTEGRSGSCAYEGKVRHYYKTGASPQATSYAKKHCTKALKGTFLPAK